MPRLMKVTTTILLSLSLVTVFSIGSLASSAGSDAVDESMLDAIPLVQVPSGNLTARGRVDINGNEAKTGATVLSNSSVHTHVDSHAEIDMAAVGRVEAHALTQLVLSWQGNEVTTVLSRCGGVTQTVPAGTTGVVKILQKIDTEVEVHRGQVTVKYGNGQERIITAGNDREFDNATEVIAQGDAVFKVHCGEDYPLVALFALPAGLLFLAGGEDFVPPVLSELNPNP